MRSRRSNLKMRWVFLLAGALLIFTAGAALRDRKAPSADAADRDVVTEQIADSQDSNPAADTQPEGAAEAVDLVAEQPTGLSGVQQQAAGGLTIEASNLRFEADETGGITVSLDICHPMPENNHNWFIYSASLSFAGFVVGDYGTIPIEILLVKENGTVLFHEYVDNEFTTSERPALESEESYRCDTLYFWGQPDEVRYAELKITIDALSADPSEGQTCTPDLVVKAQEAMDARLDGIVIGCSADGSGYAGVAIVQIPDEISQETADEIFTSNDFYLDVFGVKGPWEFTYPEK